MEQDQIERTPLIWSAHEYEEVRRPADWFIAVAIITITLAVAAVLIDNVLFAIVIVISSIALVLNAIKKPRFLDYEINNEGIIIGDFKYPYSSLYSFWIVKEENKVLIKPSKVMGTMVTIPIKDVPEGAIRDFLLQYIPEEEILEPLSQKIMERLGF